MSDRRIETVFEGVARGRVNLIGEHTDYNEGFVLPTAIPQRTVARVSLRPDMTVDVASEAVPEGAYAYLLGEETRTGGWVDYVQGLTLLLAESVRLRGFELRIQSDVPMGAGVSSSAALEMAVLKALCRAFGVEWDPLRMARLCQRVENDFVGAHVGIMDPLAAGMATDGVALFIDTRTLDYERISLPVGRMELAVVNSGVRHRNANGGYNERRRECQEACEMLGVAHLRDVRSVSLAEDLPEPLGRRARHVISENQRVLEAVEAIRDENVGELGRLFLASHRSMRDDFEVSIPETDFLVEAAMGAGALGARLTGGGFGGSVVILCEPGRALEIAQQVMRSYSLAHAAPPSLLMPVGVPGGKKNAKG